MRSDDAIGPRQVGRCPLDGFACELDRLEVVAADLRARDRIHETGERGGSVAEVDCGVGGLLGVDRNHDEVFRHRDSHQLEQRSGIARHGQLVERCTQAQIVRDATVDEVDVSLHLRVGVPLDLARDAIAARITLAARECHIEPGGTFESTLAGAVLQRQRREQHRYRRRSGDCVCQRKGAEIGADQVEVTLRQREPETVGEIRRVDVDPRPVSARQIGEGGVIEDVLVVVLRSEDGAAHVGREEAEQVARTEHHPNERALDVAPQKSLLEVLEDSVSKQPVVGRWEAPTRDTADRVDLVEKPPAFAVDHDLGVAELFQDAVGESRRPGSAA